jgi:hypothetical protein
VARNPILAQPITNGHAARMRFSRFRSAVLGLEPQRRNRVNKKKKEEPVKKPKQDEDEEKSSGSGIGNIKTEIKAERRVSAAIKSEQPTASSTQSISMQPPAPMASPRLVKAESANTNTHTEAQFIREPSVFCVTDIKKETVTQPTVTSAGPSNSVVTTTTLVSVAEMTPGMMATSDNIVTTTPTAVSASATPFIDNSAYPRMPLRLPTPCSDSDGMSTFLRHTPPPSAGSDIFLNHRPYPHPHHYQHKSQHSHAMVGAASPPLSTPASSPYELAQCLDFDPSSAPGSAGSPWQSQQTPFHNPFYDTSGGGNGQAYQHSQPPTPSPMFPVSVHMNGGYHGYNNPHATPFSDHHLRQHHYHQPQHHQPQQNYHHTILPHPFAQHSACGDEDAPGELDPLTMPLGVFPQSNNTSHNEANNSPVNRDITRFSQPGPVPGKFHRPSQVQSEAHSQSQPQTPSQAQLDSQTRSQTPVHAQEQTQSPGHSQNLAGASCGKDTSQASWTAPPDGLAYSL